MIQVMACDEEKKKRRRRKRRGKEVISFCEVDKPLAMANK